MSIRFVVNIDVHDTNDIKEAYGKLINSFPVSMSWESTDEAYTNEGKIDEDILRTAMRDYYIERNMFNKYKKNPNQCPFCDSNDIECTDDGYGYLEISKQIRCNNCEKMWNEVFEMKWIEEV